MNREQKRKFVKDAKKRGVKETEAKAYAEIISSGSGKNTKAQEIKEDEKVKLNLEAIKARKNYERLSPKYKEFVESNEDTVFLAHVERPNIISMKDEENKQWLFWSGDLIKVGDENDG